MNVSAYMWRSEDNIQEESVLFFHSVGPRDELKLSGLVVGAESSSLVIVRYFTE